MVLGLSSESDFQLSDYLGREISYHSCSSRSVITVINSSDMYTEINIYNYQRNQQIHNFTLFDALSLEIHKLGQR